MSGQSKVDAHRRHLLKIAGAGTLVFSVGGCERALTPRAARAAGADFRTLTAPEVETLERLGDVLVPGAAEAGLTHFVDGQLSAPAESFMGTLRYVDWPPPFADFYREALAAVDAHARRTYGAAYADLSAGAAVDLVATLAAGQPDGWAGPPAPLVYFVLRSDAVDIVYGTPAGFARLGVPYLAHIAPPGDWP